MEPEEHWRTAERLFTATTDWRSDSPDVPAWPARSGWTATPWSGRRDAVLRLAADSEQGDVVVGLLGEDVVEQPVAELVDGGVGQPGEHGGEPGEAGVEVDAAVFDQPVGDQQ